MSIFTRLRSFLILWLGQTVSQLGSQMTSTALLIWAFGREGTVMSVALLAVCGYVPTMIASVVAGPIVEKLNKKLVMLVADSIAALSTVGLLLLYHAGGLTTQHLYLVRAILGVSGAFQSPASGVTVTALVPKQDYLRVSGLQSFSGSLMGVLAPVLGTAALAFGGLDTVLWIDLGTFAFAFTTLLFLKIPRIETEGGKAGERYFASLRSGARFIRQSKGIWHLFRYLMLLNLVAGVAYYSVLGPMILARTGGSEMALGWVNTCIGLGAMAGGLILTGYKPKMSRVSLMCFSYMLSFALCDVMLGVGRSLPVWCLAAFLGNITLPFGDGALSTLLRENIPIDKQGRAFSLQLALVTLATTIGYLTGALMADYAALPLVMAANPVSAFLRLILGVGDGRAMGLVFLLTGLLGIAASLALRKDKSVIAMDEGRGTLGAIRPQAPDKG